MRLPILSLLFLNTLAHVATCKSSQSKASCILDYSRLRYRAVSDVWNGTFSHELRQLGKGTTGQVTLVQLTRSDALVAVKTFATNHTPRSQRGEDPTHCVSKAQNVREIQLEHHIGNLLNQISGVTRTFDLIHDTSSCMWHLVSEFVSQSLVQRHKTLSTAQKVHVLERLAAIIHEIHHQGVAHGDIKLENILLTDDLNPKIIDFGSSTFAHCPVESPVDPDGNTVCNVVPGDYGTVAYMPPEVFKQLEYNRMQADIWSLGILALVIFNDSVPWKVAEESDSNWRRYMGWETNDPECQAARKCCVTQAYRQRRSLSSGHFCPASRSPFLDRLPTSVKESVVKWLTVNPGERSIS